MLMPAVHARPLSREFFCMSKLKVVVLKSRQIRYVVEGLLTTALGGGVRIFCEGNEFSIIQPPNGRTCANYLDAYINARGGYLDNGSATSDCRFCQYSSGDQYLNTVRLPFISEVKRAWSHLCIIYIRSATIIDIVHETLASSLVSVMATY